MVQGIAILLSRFANLFLREEGQDLMEYVLVITLVALGATAGIGTLASQIGIAFSGLGSSLNAAF